MGRWIDIVETFVEHPFLNLIVAVFLLICGVSEVIRELDREFSLGVHHGMILFGLVHTLKSVSLMLKTTKVYR